MMGGWQYLLNLYLFEFHMASSGSHLWPSKYEENHGITIKPNSKIKKSKLYLELYLKQNWLKIQWYCNIFKKNSLWYRLHINQENLLTIPGSEGVLNSKFTTSAGFQVLLHASYEQIFVSWVKNVGEGVMGNSENC